MRDFIRRWRAALIAVTAAAALAGCDAGPSRVGAAAIVGDTRIPLDVVQQDFRWLLNNIPQARQLQKENKLELLSRYAVHSRVRHELIEAAAERAGISADPRKVQEMIDNAGGEARAPQQLLARPGLARKYAEDIVLLQELGAHYVDRVSVKVVGTFVVQESPGSTSKSKAMELGRKIAAQPEKARELAAQGDQVVDDTLVLSDVLRSRDSVLAQTPLFAVQPGTVVITQPDPQQGSVWLVALVEERSETVSATSRPPKYQPEQLAQVGLQMLRPEAQRLGVTVSPRFGVWDQSGMTIAESSDHLSGTLLTARASRQ